MTKTAQTKIAMRRIADHLQPVNEYGFQQLMKIPRGEVVTITIKMDRSRRQNAFYWTLISLVWSNLDHTIFPKPENFHTSLKAMLGEFDEVWLPSGSYMINPDTGETVCVTESTRVLQVGSTSFGKMNGIEFGKYLDRTIDLVIQYWMPTTKRKDLLSEVSQMVGITYEEVTK